MVKMDLRTYVLIGFTSGAMGCAGPVNLLREDKVPYIITCDYPESNELPMPSAYNIDPTVRHICLESATGEKFTLKFREGGLSGKARELVNDISDKVEGEEVMLSREDLLDAQRNLDDGCTVSARLR